MTEVLHSPLSSSSSSSAPISPTPNGALFQAQTFLDEEGISGVTGDFRKEREGDRDQLPLLALLVTLFRKSFWAVCRTEREGLCGMEIGWPTNVRHVAHVTFDRFNGFLGLPVEFEPEVPRRAPSASATVFGVSTESMQLAFDVRGNSVPTILLLMQRHLYAQGGLQAEGIFRINAENSQEEHVRDQLNAGVVPEGIDVHCLAGLIKAWFRELPTGVLDTLSPEQVMRCESEEDCTALVRLLPATDAALLDWAINLMADVVQEEYLNKMNARNIAMVFAPNMTQMVDPLTALMYAVQVMNFLRMLIEKRLQERHSLAVGAVLNSDVEPSDENGHRSSSLLCLKATAEEDNEDTELPAFAADEPNLENASESYYADIGSDDEYLSYSTSTEESDGVGYYYGIPIQARKACVKTESSIMNVDGSRLGQSSYTKEQGPAKNTKAAVVVVPVEGRSKGMSSLSLINSRTELIEAWR